MFAHFHLVLTLKMPGVTLPFLHTPSRCAYRSTRTPYLATFSSES